ncbi:hypothetical protein [Streptomyces xanthochromogenes]|uniref:hypothetical protein n=1 Tax=Streptomyces xanthochromogenes TaxID=67384 RepID=UPI0034222376
MLDRFTQFCVQALPSSGPDITGVEPWQGDDAPAYGIAVTFSSGSRLWLQITGGLAPGTQTGQATTAASGAVLEPVALPALFDETGTVSPLRAEAYLAAAFTHTDSTEIAQVYGYSSRPGQPAQHPGLGVILRNGARLYMPFVHTAKAGQDRGRSPFRLQSSF